MVKLIDISQFTSGTPCSEVASILHNQGNNFQNAKLKKTFGRGGIFGRRWRLVSLECFPPSFRKSGQEEKRSKGVPLDMSRVFSDHDEIQIQSLSDIVTIPRDEGKIVTISNEYTNK